MIKKRITGGNKMNVAVVYSSKSGHTKKIAEAMAKELGVEAKNILDKPVFNNIDLLLIGTGIYAGKIAPALYPFLETIDSKTVKNAVIFSTAMSPNVQTATLRDLLTRRGIAVKQEEFLCKGKFLLFNTQHPNEEDVKNAVEFARKIAK